jgi:hypothetical protein
MHARSRCLDMQIDFASVHKQSPILLESRRTYSPSLILQDHPAAHHQNTIAVCRHSPNLSSFSLLCPRQNPQYDHFRAGKLGNLNKNNPKVKQI